MTFPPEPPLRVVTFDGVDMRLADSPPERFASRAHQEYYDFLADKWWSGSCLSATPDDTPSRERPDQDGMPVRAVQPEHVYIHDIPRWYQDRGAVSRLCCMEGDWRRAGELANKNTAIYMTGNPDAKHDLFIAVWTLWNERNAGQSNVLRRRELGHFAAALLQVADVAESDVLFPHASMVQIHKTLSYQVKGLGLAMGFELDRVFESTFMTADTRSWSEFKKDNPGTSGTLRFSLNVVTRSSALPEERPDIWSEGVEQVLGLANGEEGWVWKRMTLKDAIEMILQAAMVQTCPPASDVQRDAL